MVIATLAPLLRSPPRDSYPLSTYPMFSTHRGRDSAVATAVGLDGNEVRRLSPSLIGGTDEVMLAVQTVAGAVRVDGAETLCVTIAERVATAGQPDVDEVVVRIEHHDPVAFFAGDRRAPEHVEQLARCAVP